MREAGISGLLVAGCVTLFLLMVLLSVLSMERQRLQQFSGRILSVRTGGSPRTRDTRAQVGALSPSAWFGVPVSAMLSMLGLASSLGVALMQLLGLRGWLGLVGIAAGPVALAAWRINAVSGRSVALARQAHGVLSEMHLAASGGETPASALAQATARTKEPLRSLLTNVLRAHAAGESLVVALERAHHQAKCWELGMLVDAVRLQADTECSLSQLLAEIVERADEALVSRRELTAKLGEAQWTARVLALVPVCLAGYLAAARPWALEPLTADPVGKACLTLGGLLWLGGIAFTGYLQRPPDRFRHWA